jgi:hypothetical protein
MQDAEVKDNVEALIRKRKFGRKPLQIDAVVPNSII